MSDEEADFETSANADELIVRAKSDRAAFSQLYERYYSEVSRYCLRRLLIRSIAEDVVSDVFLQIASHLPTFPGRTETDFRRWLFRIVTNAIHACLRQTHRRQELLAEAALSGRLKSDTNSLAEDDMLDWPTLYQAIEELDERDRTIVMLRFFSNCSFEEIAAVVDAKPGAVRTALSRVLARLREKFKFSGTVDNERGAPPQVNE